MSGIFSCLVLLKHIIDFFKPNVIKEGIPGSVPITQLNAKLSSLSPKMPNVEGDFPKVDGNLSKYKIKDIKLDDKFNLGDPTQYKNQDIKLLDNPPDNPHDKSSRDNKSQDRETKRANDDLTEIIIKIFNKGEIEINK